MFHLVVAYRSHTDRFLRGSNTKPTVWHFNQSVWPWKAGTEHVLDVGCWVEVSARWSRLKKPGSGSASSQGNGNNGDASAGCTYRFWAGAQPPQEGCMQFKRKIFLGV